MGLCWENTELERRKLKRFEGRDSRERGARPHPAAEGSALPRWGRFFGGGVGWGLEVRFYDEWEVVDWEGLD